MKFAVKCNLLISWLFISIEHFESQRYVTALRIIVAASSASSDRFKSVPIYSFRVAKKTKNINKEDKNKCNEQVDIESV